MSLRVPSCPFVCIRGSYSFRHFVPFVYFVLFVVHPLLNGRVAELPRGRAHARHPRTAFSSLFPMKNYSCPFVFIRGSYLSAPSWFIFSPSLRVHSWFVFLPSFRAFRVFRAFRGSSPPQWTRGRIAARARPRAPSTHCLLLSIPYEKLFVSIRVHSWFISFRPFVVHILSIPSCPFVASRTTAPSKNRPAILERLSKRFTFLPATRRHRSRMGLPGRPR